MTVAQAVRPNRPLTRSTRGTNGANETQTNTQPKRRTGYKR
ncbi:hypothetical protein [Pontibacillus halophilus]|nr:hypothetical protein [Pontibacillus halophilus]